MDDVKDNKAAVERISLVKQGCAKWIEGAYDLAIGALEKQIPKKPTHEASLYKCCTCPSCKNVFDKFEVLGDRKVRITYNYCHFCGQKLDWE